MKNAKAYKSAIYISDSFAGGFWNGKAVDHQISGDPELSDYWIREFLQSELLTTGPAGTKRLAVALRSATRIAEDLQVRRELISAAGLLRGRDGQPISARQVVEQLGLSQEAVEALETAFSRVDLMDEVFQFDLEEFIRQAAYHAVELDNGALLIAEEVRFEDVFDREDLNIAEGRVRYTTEGRVVDEKLRYSK